MWYNSLKSRLLFFYFGNIQEVSRERPKGRIGAKSHPHLWDWPSIYDICREKGSTVSQHFHKFKDKQCMYRTFIYTKATSSFSWSLTPNINLHAVSSNTIRLQIQRPDRLCYDSPNVSSEVARRSLISRTDYWCCDKENVSTHHIIIWKLLGCRIHTGCVSRSSTMFCGVEIIIECKQ